MLPASFHARGFSLVEVLVAVAILTTAVAGLSHLLVLGARAHQAARADSTVTLLAAGKLEALLARPRAARGRDQGQELLDAAGRAAGSGLSRPAAYLRRWSAVPEASGTGLLALTVSVVPWHGREGPAAPMDDVGRLPGAVTLFTLQRQETP